MKSSLGLLMAGLLAFSGVASAAHTYLLPASPGLGGEMLMKGDGAAGSGVAFDARRAIARADAGEFCALIVAERPEVAVGEAFRMRLIDALARSKGVYSFKHEKLITHQHEFKNAVRKAAREAQWQQADIRKLENAIPTLMARMQGLTAVAVDPSFYAASGTVKGIGIGATLR